MLGQILTDEGLATKEQVDGAFGKQGALKKALAEVRKAEGFLGENRVFEFIRSADPLLISVEGFSLEDGNPKIQNSRAKNRKSSYCI